ncbi:MAG: phage/plasmid replication protein [Patescibacteria group bacterium]|nr:phage/plasmid replication protein [Patescibacteria group bacterium]
MIDTIQVEIPMIHFDILTSELGYLFRDNPDVVIAGLLSPVTGEFSPFSSTQMSELASNERKVMVRVNISQDYIQVQFSLPKFILGTNAVEYSNLLLGLYHFRQFIAERLGIIEEDLGDPKFWNLTRLDLCKNIDCQTQSFRDAILFRLQKQAHNAFIRKKKSLIFQTSVYLPSSYHTLKWYLKYEEYVNTQRKGDQKKEQKNLLPKDFSKTVEEYSKPILRFEIELRRAALQNKVFGYIYSQNEKTKHIAQNKALDLIDQCEIPIKIKLWAMNRYKRSEYTLFVDYMLKELSLEKIL